MIRINITDVEALAILSAIIDIESGLMHVCADPEWGGPPGPSFTEARARALKSLLLHHVAPQIAKAVGGTRAGGRWRMP